jgi:hypothetical protein
MVARAGATSTRPVPACAGRRSITIAGFQQRLDEAALIDPRIAAAAGRAYPSVEGRALWVRALIPGQRADVSGVFHASRLARIALNAPVKTRTRLAFTACFGQPAFHHERQRVGRLAR